MGAPEVTGFLTSLAVNGSVAASTQNQALSALLFLYKNVLELDLPWLDGIVRARRPERLPVVLTREEVRAVLQRLDGVPRLMACLLRCLRLQPDPGAGRQGRQGPHHHAARGGEAGPGTPSRACPRTAPAGPPARRRVGRAADGPGTQVSERGPGMGVAWVFPATRTYVDRLTGHRRWHHLHESVLQRVVKEAGDWSNDSHVHHGRHSDVS